tara:strand:+ start:143382 stop:144626 length:1245 start_codon:yes stop_codon:yes gene_type:complete
MPGESFRFIQASDFHLENPLGDLDVLPSQLREALAEAPWKAAAAVFEAALADNIDFLVLCGDILSPQAAGPHGMAMLLDYCDKLHAKNTPVFWAAGIADDSKKWPESAPLPPNVTMFPKDRTVAIPVERAGRTICNVVGRSCDGRGVLHVPSFRVEPSDEFTVAVGYGTADADALAEGRFDFWALGGRHNPLEVDGAAEGGAVYCGTPQGRDLTETGPHGYCIVDVDADQTTRVHRIECDSFRYCYEEIDASEIRAVGNIRNVLSQRIARLQHENGGRHLIIGWDIAIASGDDLHTIGDAEDLRQWLRREYGHGSPSAWTARLSVRPPRNYPSSWQDEDTILGDFLRIAQQHLKTDGRELKLATYTEEQVDMPATTATMLSEIPASVRTDVLEQATLLGVELLRGGKPQLVTKS